MAGQEKGDLLIQVTA